MAAPGDVDALDAAVTSSLRAADAGEPLDRAVALGALIELLQKHVDRVAVTRDAAILAVLSGPHPPSHRALAAQLGVSGQRVDQLARLARDRRRN